MAIYNLISTVTVGAGGAASIAFTSIPQTYTDLKILLSLRSNRADVDDVLLVKPNNSSSSLTYRYIRGSGSSIESSNVNRAYIAANTLTANVFSSNEIYIPNYTGNTHKSFLIDSVTENNSATAYMSLQSVLWSVSDAITSVVFVVVYGSLFLQYSSASLYGISKT